MAKRYANGVTIRYYAQRAPILDARGVPTYGLIPKDLARTKEPPHVALANLLPDEKSLAKFTRTYGVIAGDALHFRDILRKAWEGDRSMLEWMSQRHNRASVYVESSGLRITADDAWEGACLLFLLDRQVGRAAKCASPDCPAPYFLRVRKGQKFCSHRCAVLVSVRKLRKRQQKAMRLLEATERKGRAKR